MTKVTAKAKRFVVKPRLHSALKMLPWRLQPAWARPVFAGDTLAQAKWTFAGRSDRLKSVFGGAFSEYCIFYVPFSKLFDEQTLDGIFDSPEHSFQTEIGSGGGENRSFFRTSSGYHWLEAAYHAVVDQFFRPDGKDHTDFADSDGVCQVALGYQDAIIRAVEGILDDDVTVSPNGTGGYDANEIMEALTKFQILQQQGVTDQTYRDFLRSEGISISETKKDSGAQAELIRYDRKWTKNATLTDPSSGTLDTAWLFDHAGDASKNRFFKEPGILFGCIIVRPKVYLDGKIGSYLSRMTKSAQWSPIYINNLPAGETAMPLTDGQVWDQIQAGSDLDLPIENLIRQGEYFNNHNDGTRMPLVYGDTFHQLDLATNLDAVFPKHLDALEKTLFQDDTKTHCWFEGLTTLTMKTAVKQPTLIPELPVF